MPISTNIKARAFLSLFPRSILTLLLAFLLVQFSAIPAHAVPDGEGNEIFVGNVGVGTTTPVGGMTVMSGNVGIGTWKPGAPLEIFDGNTNVRLRVSDSGLSFGRSSDGLFTSSLTASNGVVTVLGSTNIVFNSNNRVGMIVDYDSPLDSAVVRVGPSTPAEGVARLSVQGAAAVGSSYANITHEPADGLIVQGNVGLGTTSPRGSLIVASGSVGIGTLDPVGGLSVMSGNVGIGTWSPSEALEVVGTVSATAFAGDGSALTGLPAGAFTDGGTNIFITDDFTNNVAIGTTTPAARLHVRQADAADALYVEDQANDSSPVVINANGNLGIGTTNPTVSLDVRGSIYQTGTFSGTALSLSGWGTVIGGQTLFGTANLQSKLAMGTGVSVLTGNYVGTGVVIGPGFNEAGAGTHPFIGSLAVRPPSVTAGAASVTDAATIYVEDQPGVTVTGGNYAIWVDDGVSRFDGNVGIGTGTPVGALSVMSGNVGIGTWSPTGSLQVVGGDLKVGLGTFDNPSANFDIYTTGNLEVDGSIFLADGTEINGAGDLGTASGWTDDGAVVRLDTASDRVGIGTTLNAAGTALSVMNGNVGIGTWNAASRLEVEGDVQVAFGYRFQISSNAYSFARGVGESAIDVYAGHSSNAVAMLGDVEFRIRSGAAMGWSSSAVSVEDNAADLTLNRDAADILALRRSTNTQEYRIYNTYDGVNDEFVSLGFKNNTDVFTLESEATGTGAVRDLVVLGGNVGIGTTTPVGGFVVMSGNVGIGTWSPNSELEVTTSLAIPQGTAPTVARAGEIAVDTTDDQLIYYGGAKRVLTYKTHKALIIESPADADNLMLWKTLDPITITNIECIVDPADAAESVVIDLQERDGSGDNAATVDATITCDNDGASDDGSLSNGAIDGGDWLSLDIGTVTGTVTQLSVTIYYTVDAE